MSTPTIVDRTSTQITLERLGVTPMDSDDVADIQESHQEKWQRGYHTVVLVLTVLTLGTGASLYEHLLPTTVGWILFAAFLVPLVVAAGGLIFQLDSIRWEVETVADYKQAFPHERLPEPIEKLITHLGSRFGPERLQIEFDVADPLLGVFDPDTMSLIHVAHWSRQQIHYIGWTPPAPVAAVD